jgi:serine/threonine protein kinase
MTSIEKSWLGAPTLPDSPPASVVANKRGAGNAPSAGPSVPTISGPLAELSSPPLRPTPQLRRVAIPGSSLAGKNSLAARRQGLLKMSLNPAMSALGKRSVSELTLDLSKTENANKRQKMEHFYPKNLLDKSLKFSSQRFGAGSNGVVCGVLVDGEESLEYVIKTSLMQGGRPSDATIEMLEKECKINRELAEISKKTPLRGVLVGAGTATIDNQLCLVLPRIHGEPLAQHIQTSYEHCLAGRMEPEAFVNMLRQAIDSPLAGLAALHANGLVANDLNAGNFMYGRLGNTTDIKDSVLIDFGCAGHIGQHAKPGTIGTIAPERIESSNDAAAPRSARNHPLSPASDAYSLGCVLHYFVHGNYPSWSSAAAHLPEDQQMLELSTTTEKFIERGTLLPARHSTAHASLRTDSAREVALRNALYDAGFYEILEGLTRPDPTKRMSVQQARVSSFFNDTAKPAARAEAKPILTFP